MFYLISTFFLWASIFSVFARVFSKTFLIVRQNLSRSQKILSMHNIDGNFIILMICIIASTFPEDWLWRFLYAKLLVFLIQWFTKHSTFNFLSGLQINKLWERLGFDMWYNIFIEIERRKVIATLTLTLHWMNFMKGSTHYMRSISKVAGQCIKFIQKEY